MIANGERARCHGRTGHAGTQFEPHTEGHAKERASFAHQLADYLNEEVTGQRCKGLRSSVASDLTSYVGPELKKRLNHALRLSE